jgi:F420-dependent oxidoreductase-like protein
MKFGIQLPQAGVMFAGIKDPVQAYETMTQAAQLADECGYETVWLCDHFMPTVLHPSAREEDIVFECWTTLSALARDTKRVRLGQAVTCNGYRNPALLAKMASTVDVLSHGRLTLGIGAGDYEEEFRAYGYAYPDAPVRLRQLREAAQVLLAMWTQDEATFEGQYYQVRGAINEPKGVQKPHIPLLIGGAGEQVTLKIVAHYADACNVFGAPAAMEHKFAVLKAHCEAVGRPYESIRRTATVLCAIGETDEQALASITDAERAMLVRNLQWMGKSLAKDDALVEAGTALATGGEHSAFLSMGLIGSPETIRKSIAAHEAAGVQEVRLHLLDGAKPESIRLFAKAFIKEGGM